MLLAILLLFVSIVLLIRTEWAQSKIIGYATNYYEDKTNTTLEIDKLYVTFGGDLLLKGLYAEDQNQDTLLYTKQLQTGVDFSPLLSGEIHVSAVNWDKLVARVHRKPNGQFNFDYIIEAFSSGPSPPDTTTSAPPQISLSPIQFEQFDLQYIDSTLGTSAHLVLGHLLLETDNIDLENLEIALETLAIEDTKVDVAIFSEAVEPPEKTPETDAQTTASSPKIAWKRISLDNIQFTYNSLGDSTKAKSSIGHFESRNAAIDLEKKSITMDNILLANSDAQIKMLVEGKVEQSTPTNQEPATFTWPDWKIGITEVALENNHFTYDVGAAKPQPEIFDPEHLAISDIHLLLRNINLQNQQVAVDLQNLQFTERCGFQLQQFHSSLRVNNTGISAHNTKLQTPYNLFLADLNLHYKHLDSLIAKPMDFTKVHAAIKPSTLSLRDAFFFNDSLQYDSLMLQLANEPSTISGNVHGNMREMTIAELQIDAFDTTQLSLDGKIYELSNIDQMEFDIPVLKLRTKATDITRFAAIKPSEIPENILLTSQLKGNLQSLTASVNCNTSDGNATFEGLLQDLLQEPSAKGTLITHKFNLAKYTNEPDLDPVSLKLDFDAKGADLNTLAISADMQFTELAYKKVDYSALNIQANFQDRKATLSLEHHQPFLDAAMVSTANIGESNSDAELHIDVKMADLHAMKLDTSQFKMAFNANAKFAGNQEAFNAGFHLNNGQIKHNGEAFTMEPLSTNMSSDNEQTQFNIASGFLNGNFAANESLELIIKSLDSYITEAIASSTAKTPLAQNQHLEMDARFKLNLSPILSELISPGLSRLDTVTMSLDFKPAQELLKLQILAPKAIYNELEVDQFAVMVDASNQGITGSFGFKELLSDPVHIHNTQFSMEIADSNGRAKFVIHNEAKKEVMYMAANITNDGNDKMVKLDHEHLVLNSETWNIDPQNQVQIGHDVQFSHFTLSRNQQRVILHTNETAKTFNINFRQFELAAITAALNAEEQPATGQLSGNITITDLDKSPAATANILLSELAVTDIALGELSLSARNRGYDFYDLNARLEGVDIDTRMTAKYRIAEEDQIIDANIDVAKINVQLLETLAPEMLSKTSGYMAGNLTLSGSVVSPDYQGRLYFVNAKLTPNMLGTGFAIKKQAFTLDNQGIYFNNFTMYDARGESSTLDGTVSLANMGNPGFKLQFKAQNFQFLDAKKSTKEDYYGKGLVDIEASINGDANLPKVQAQLHLKNGTDITYVIPYTQAQIQEREGIVRFKNMQAPETAFQDDAPAVSSMTGIDLQARIKVDPKSRLTIVIDPQTGDYLTVQGEANLQFNMRPNGQMDLVGKYEVNDGTYGMNLYELVSKEFNILEGSSITWTGDPLEAEMDITGEYQVLTSSVDLMANEIDVNNQATVNRYRQKLPYEVKLLIGGQILKPEIAFGIELPDKHKNTLDGTVYNRLQRLNQNESELNLQVFSLIVFNKFLPSNVAAETGNTTSELARNSVSNLLSDQLNLLSDKYIKGVELDFDLDSYTDYQSGAAQQKTDLNVSLKKSLLDDRLVIEVSSQMGVEGEESNSQVLGDVSIEYLLTEDGRLRAKTFRENQFQDMVEGQVMITGLSLLFSKEFDNLSDLRKPKESK